MEIENKIAVVTGGANGVGKAITTMLLQNGARVAVLDFDKVSLESFEDNQNLLKISCDVTKDSDIKNAIEIIKKKFKKIDILINNAGILHSELLINITTKEKKHNFENWKKTIETNLTAPFLMTTYAVEMMVVNRVKGVIVNISSISAKGNIGQTAYSAAKAGLESMTKVWAKELGIFGIRSIALAPGFIDTKSTYKAITNETLKTIKQQMPLKKLGEIEDITQSVKFLIENNFMNGKVLQLDGGLFI